MFLKVTCNEIILFEYFPAQWKVLEIIVKQEDNTAPLILSKQRAGGFEVST